MANSEDRFINALLQHKRASITLILTVIGLTGSFMHFMSSNRIGYLQDQLTFEKALSKKPEDRTDADKARLMKEFAANKPPGCKTMYYSEGLETYNVGIAFGDGTCGLDFNTKATNTGQVHSNSLPDEQ